ncbi:hypothetical protein SLI_0148 [Streptomyces lividans 1326]|uniref:Uncharacterized protein n=1 Tax=Streptomyces lividans 1326 TaxID=1200984 RepID=A0A7U9DL14_STRLI|nr:hypothetical protein SLI_0148 [Streptomyces lividans 1326]
MVRKKAVLVDLRHHLVDAGLPAVPHVPGVGVGAVEAAQGQPLVKRTNRVPGPSTPVDRSQEWIRPVTVPGAVVGSMVLTAIRGRCG